MSEENVKIIKIELIHCLRIVKGIYYRSDFVGGLAGAPARDLLRVVAVAYRDESSQRTVRSAARGLFHPLGYDGRGGRIYNDNNIIDRYDPFPASKDEGQKMFPVPRITNLYMHTELNRTAVIQRTMFITS